MMLPTRGQLEGRMLVTACEQGLDNVTEENHLKDILTSVVSRRKAYRLRDGHFKYAFGTSVTPQPSLKNSVNPASPPPPGDAQQQAALLLARSGDTRPASLPPANIHSHTHCTYALNIERIIMKLWHQNDEELQQDKVHRQRLAAKEGLLLC
ncbi:unnamed protein product [Nyctereutes procyonoides]|uniref:(raccoon dog) hypothetical protein n=1 Tax=Nyctereutes procyonoides TaxID=34880 RepID=A0A811XZ48_NYCPR|nr:unnamed protein product [Nyctereutes procyonoides]